ncbi:hypothetical protein KPL35_09810 [Clostridium sp. CF011]|uniref:site-2 protease family protein n=1 Tax=unclassified Clostridium TaxID=2614128 RepID=UPI001C0D08EE|nr:MULTISPECIES: site-2 protease family protein [unclassified Clostridium]MBU3092374.1 hypothetical protein [Clostridium sp. CF011]MBW9146010.1 hypothetical protein [Clostridium sp. CM027]UVE39480.1 hypothetical protein KTC92_09460 [Clostridium sp. CM027]WAG68386.1 hypothetical protein LL036_09725 [Clostridium sp. CF011]
MNISNKKIMGLVSFFVGIDILIILTALCKIKNLSIDIESVHKYSILILLVLLLSCIYIDIIIHELGHFIAGKLVGFKFYSFTIFPFEIRNQNQKVIFQITGNYGLLGSCMMYPKTFSKLFKELLIYYLGGIGLNFIFIIAYLFLIIYKVPNMNNIFIKIFFCFLLIISEFNLIKNVIPSKVNGMKTDGSNVLTIINPSDSNDIDLMEMVISLQLFCGIRPRDINFKVLNNRNIFSDKSFHEYISLYYFYYYLDSGNFDKAQVCIGIIEENIDEYTKDVRLDVMCEILYSYCYIKKDINKSKEIYTQISQVLLNDKSIGGFRIQMAYELYIKKDIVKALEFGQSGLSLVNQDEVKGIDIFEKAEIERMIERISNYSN